MFVFGICACLSGLLGGAVLRYKRFSDELGEGWDEFHL